MKNEGHSVTAYECRLMFRRGQENGVINKLSELGTKLGWDATKMKRKFKEEQSKPSQLSSNFKRRAAALLLNVCGIRSKLNMYAIHHVVNGHGIIGRTETIYNAFALDIDTHEDFTGKNKL